MNGDGAHEHQAEVESKQNGHEVGEQAEDGSEQEVIVIQDTGFTVKIQCPGIEPFSIQVTIYSSHFSVSCWAPLEMH